MESVRLKKKMSDAIFLQLYNLPPYARFTLNMSNTPTGTEPDAIREMMEALEPLTLGE